MINTSTVCMISIAVLKYHRFFPMVSGMLLNNFLGILLLFSFFLHIECTGTSSISKLIDCSI